MSTTTTTTSICTTTTATSIISSPTIYSSPTKVQTKSDSSASSPPNIFNKIFGNASAIFSPRLPATPIFGAVRFQSTNQDKPVHFLQSSDEASVSSERIIPVTSPPQVSSTHVSLSPSNTPLKSSLATTSVSVESSVVISTPSQVTDCEESPSSRKSPSPSLSSSSSLSSLEYVTETFSPPTLSSLAHSVVYPTLLSSNSSPTTNTISENPKVPITNMHKATVQTDQSFFGDFLEQMLHYSPPPLTDTTESRPSTEFLLRPSCVTSSEIDSDVLKFLLDHVISKCNSFDQQLSELSSKVEIKSTNSCEDIDQRLPELSSKIDRKSTKICEDIDDSMDGLVNQFNRQFNDLKKSVAKEPRLQNEFADTGTSLLTQKLKELEKSVFDLDVRLIECEQYPRRENIVISGIPEFVTHDHLKEQVVTICYNLGLDITEHDIAACHRLPKGEHSRWPANTIVRFYSRDHVASCLKNSYKLKSSRFKRETEMN